MRLFLVQNEYPEGLSAPEASLDPEKAEKRLLEQAAKNLGV